MQRGYCIPQTVFSESQAAVIVVIEKHGEQTLVNTID
jgi:hypothetical protein